VDPALQELDEAQQHDDHERAGQAARHTETFSRPRAAVALCPEPSPGRGVGAEAARVRRRRRRGHAGHRRVPRRDGLDRLLPASRSPPPGVALAGPGLLAPRSAGRPSSGDSGLRTSPGTRRRARIGPQRRRPLPGGRAAPGNGGAAARHAGGGRRGSAPGDGALRPGGRDSLPRQATRRVASKQRSRGRIPSASPAATPNASTPRSATARPSGGSPSLAARPWLAPRGSSSSCDICLSACARSMRCSSPAPAPTRASRHARWASS
jgi:hypothetical protein